jgi:hypothetical protein
MVIPETWTDLSDDSASTLLIFYAAKRAGLDGLTQEQAYKIWCGMFDGMTRADIDAVREELSRDVEACRRLVALATEGDNS